MVRCSPPYHFTVSVCHTWLGSTSNSLSWMRLPFTRFLPLLGINYPGTQTTDNTNVTQANDRSVIQLNAAHNLTSLGGGRQMSKLTIKRLRWIASFRTRERCVKHASMLKQWSNLRSLLAGSEATVRHEVALSRCLSNQGDEQTACVTSHSNLHPSSRAN